MIGQPLKEQRIGIGDRFKYVSGIVIFMETVTITKHEYQRLMELEAIDFDLVRQFATSLSDLKQGRFKRLA